MSVRRREQSEDDSVASERLSYEPLPAYGTREAVEAAASSTSPESRAVAALAVGENWPDPEYAQEVCLRLANDADSAVRASACLGLAYIARNHRNLDKRRVRPVLLRELKSQCENRGRVQDAIYDINIYLGWPILSWSHVVAKMRRGWRR